MVQSILPRTRMRSPRVIDIYTAYTIGNAWQNRAKAADFVVTRRKSAWHFRQNIQSLRAVTAMSMPDRGFYTPKVSHKCPRFRASSRHVTTAIFH
jgi:hypothetical protein